MNSKHKKTLELIFKTPIQRNIRWDDILSLLRSLGAYIMQGAGSRVKILLRGRRIVLHRPHPQKEVLTKTVKSIRKFLEQTGVLECL